MVIYLLTSHYYHSLLIRSSCTCRQKLQANLFTYFTWFLVALFLWIFLFYFRYFVIYINYTSYDGNVVLNFFVVLKFALHKIRRFVGTEREQRWSKLNDCKKTSAYFLIIFFSMTFFLIYFYCKPRLLLVFLNTTTQY